MSKTGGLNGVLVDIGEEVKFAVDRFGDFKSLHEGYSVILEKLDELWTQIKVKQPNRDFKKLRTEALHVAAMATKLVLLIDHKLPGGS